MSANGLPFPAEPRYDVDDVVTYRDRQNRIQHGSVRAVEASWRYRSGKTPLIIYDLYHPTYRNNRFYAGQEAIIGLSNGEA